MERHCSETASSSLGGASAARGGSLSAQEAMRAFHTSLACFRVVPEGELDDTYFERVVIWIERLLSKLDSRSDGESAEFLFHDPFFWKQALFGMRHPDSRVVAMATRCVGRILGKHTIHHQLRLPGLCIALGFGLQMQEESQKEGVLPLHRLKRLASAAGALLQPILARIVDLVRPHRQAELRVYIAGFEALSAVLENSLCWAWLRRSPLALESSHDCRSFLRVAAEMDLGLLADEAFVTQLQNDFCDLATFKPLNTNLETIGSYLSRALLHRNLFVQRAAIKCLDSLLNMWTKLTGFIDQVENVDLRSVAMAWRSQIQQVVNQIVDAVYCCVLERTRSVLQGSHPAVVVSDSVVTTSVMVIDDDAANPSPGYPKTMIPHETEQLVQTANRGSAFEHHGCKADDHHEESADRTVTTLSDWEDSDAHRRWYSLDTYLEQEVDEEYEKDVNQREQAIVRTFGLLEKYPRTWAWEEEDAEGKSMEVSNDLTASKRTLDREETDSQVRETKRVCGPSIEDASEIADYRCDLFEKTEPESKAEEESASLLAIASAFAFAKIHDGNSQWKLKRAGHSCVRANSDAEGTISMELISTLVGLRQNEVFESVVTRTLDCGVPLRILGLKAVWTTVLQTMRDQLSLERKVTHRLNWERLSFLLICSLSDSDGAQEMKEIVDLACSTECRSVHPVVWVATRLLEHHQYVRRSHPALFSGLLSFASKYLSKMPTSNAWPIDFLVACLSVEDRSLLASVLAATRNMIERATLLPSGLQRILNSVCLHAASNEESRVLLQFLARMPLEHNDSYSLALFDVILAHMSSCTSLGKENTFVIEGGESQTLVECFKAMLTLHLHDDQECVQSRLAKLLQLAKRFQLGCFMRQELEQLLTESLSIRYPEAYADACGLLSSVDQGVSPQVIGNVFRIACNSSTATTRAKAWEALEDCAKSGNSCLLELKSEGCCWLLYGHYGGEHFSDHTTFSCSTLLITAAADLVLRHEIDPEVILKCMDCLSATLSSHAYLGSTALDEVLLVWVVIVTRGVKEFASLHMMQSACHNTLLPCLLTIKSRSAIVASGATIPLSDQLQVAENLIKSCLENNFYEQDSLLGILRRGPHLGPERELQAMRECY